jgi:hypothetical protein
MTGVQLDEIKSGEYERIRCREDGAGREISWESAPCALPPQEESVYLL